MENHHAEHILALTQTQEYTAIASSILEAVLTNKSISNFASNLWQFLFNKAKFCKQLSITTAYSNLAEHFSVSERTIIRHINLLEKNHFLIKKQNFHKKKGRLANTFYISVPDDLLAKVKNKKTRHRNQPTLRQGDDNIVIEPGDNPVIAKDKIKKEIINNNNVGVSASLEKNENSMPAEIPIPVHTESKPEHSIESKKQEIMQLSTEKHKIEQELLLETSPLKKFDLLNQIGEITGAIEIIKHQITQHEATKHAKQQVEQAQQALLSDCRQMANQPGPRIVSQNAFARLKQTLSNLGYKDAQLNQTINEIIHEARFGSLVKQQGSSIENSVEKAINIGLKLVREGRWQSPGIQYHSSQKQQNVLQRHTKDVIFNNHRDVLKPIDYIRDFTRTHQSL